MFQIDMHVHSAHFVHNGEKAVEEMIIGYHQANIQCIVSTDHFSARRMRRFEDYFARFWEPFQIVKKAAEPTHLTVLPGAEVKFEGAHLLVFGVDPKLYINFDYSGLVESFVHSVHRFGGKVFQAHPLHKRGECYSSNIFTSVDGFEVRNGTKAPYGEPAIVTLCSEMNKLWCAGSDAHKHRHIGGAALQSLIPVNTNEDLILALTSKRVS